MSYKAFLENAVSRMNEEQAKVFLEDSKLEYEMGGQRVRFEDGKLRNDAGEISGGVGQVSNVYMGNNRLGTAGPVERGRTFTQVNSGVQTMERQVGKNPQITESVPVGSLGRAVENKHRQLAQPGAATPENQPEKVVAFGSDSKLTDKDKGASGLTDAQSQGKVAVQNEVKKAK